MRQLITVIILAMLFQSCGKYNKASNASEQNGVINLFNVAASGNVSDPNSFVGMWESRPAINEGNSTRIARMKFENNRLTVSVECRYNDGSVVYATAFAMSQLEANGDFTVLEKSTEESEPKKTPACQSDINPGRLPKQTITNGQIAAQTPQGQPYVFVKIAN